MSRIARRALAIGASVAALVGGAATAHAADGPAFVHLQAERSGKCLTIANAAIGSGAYAVQSTCADLDNQLFALTPTGSATFEVWAKHSGRCLSTDLQEEARQYMCSNSSSQHWRVIMVEVAKELYELRPMDAPELCLTSGNLDEGRTAFLTPCKGSSYARWRIQSVGS